VALRRNVGFGETSEKMWL